ncbi:tryptophan 2,3-dioxygenase family protein [Croceiramulus getboli]|nr:tryptophan 2,3-dioxygenase family protein [Flavobacteriaceae bacterium YJPT1-3]
MKESEDREIEEVLKQLHDKYEAIDQKTIHHLEGLLHGKPLTYWDYIQTDALLNLQIPRTKFPDEMVFIMYHQINELLFKMILWEIEQVAQHPQLTADFFSERLGRISRYFDMLTSSFNIMREGMEMEQYMKFRRTLTPASGFQSAQYRLIEFASTDLINLIDIRFRESIDRNTPYEHALEHLYWQAAGKNYSTGEKSYLLTAFEEKYKVEFVAFMKKYNTLNLYAKFKSLPIEVQHDEALVEAMRHYDYTVNVKWVMAHYHTAQHYLNEGKQVTEATGGSDWTKYMHPKYQRRIFFPQVWSQEELEHWGENV